jgi:DNA invertase Pin-like site-specific DNA recombinase
MKGREYLRVSVDRSGREKSNEDQHTENQAAAERHGITLGKPYRDVGSASKYARKKRDDFGRLIEDLGEGRFGAEVLVLWESSRGSRKVSEWAALIESCEAHGVKILVTSHGHLYDPSNPRDVRSMQEDAVDSQYESGKTSARVKRAQATNAVDGKPHGRIPFGYRRIYDQATKKLVRQEADPDEAPIVVELFERIAAGHSLKSIARDFADRGITSRGSEKVGPKPFTIATLRPMALAPAYRGVRVHSPNVKKGDKRPPRHQAEHTYPADWPPLVSDDLWFAVNARLKDPARVTARPGRGKHLLTMIARCDKCGGPLSATFRFGDRRYQCQDAGHVLINADDLDKWAEGEIVTLLTRPDLLERLMPQATDDAELGEARDDVARIRGEYDELIAEGAAGRITAKVIAGMEPGILARLEQAEARVQELTTPAGLSELVTPGPKVAKQWKGLPMEVKREIVRLLFAPGLLGVLSIAAVGKGGNTVEARVRLDGDSLLP